MAQRARKWYKLGGICEGVNMERLIKSELSRLRSEIKGLSVQDKKQRTIFELKMAQICILQKILRGGKKSE